MRSSNVFLSFILKPSGHGLTLGLITEASRTSSKINMRKRQANKYGNNLRDSAKSVVKTMEAKYADRHLKKEEKRLITERLAQKQQTISSFLRWNPSGAVARTPLDTLQNIFDINLKRNSRDFEKNQCEIASQLLEIDKSLLENDPVASVYSLTDLAGRFDTKDTLRQHLERAAHLRHSLLYLHLHHDVIPSSVAVLISFFLIPSTVSETALENNEFWYHTTDSEGKECMTLVLRIPSRIEPHLQLTLLRWLNKLAHVENDVAEGSIFPTMYISQTKQISIHMSSVSIKRLLLQALQLNHQELFPNSSVTSQFRDKALSNLLKWMNHSRIKDRKGPLRDCVGSKGKWYSARISGRKLEFIGEASDVGHTTEKLISLSYTTHLDQLIRYPSRSYAKELLEATLKEMTSLFVRPVTPQTISSKVFYNLYIIGTLASCVALLYQNDDSGLAEFREVQKKLSLGAEHASLLHRFGEKLLNDLISYGSSLLNHSILGKVVAVVFPGSILHQIEDSSMKQNTYSVAMKNHLVSLVISANSSVNSSMMKQEIDTLLRHHRERNAFPINLHKDAATNLLQALIIEYGLCKDKAHYENGIKWIKELEIEDNFRVMIADRPPSVVHDDFLLWETLSNTEKLRKYIGDMFVKEGSCTNMTVQTTTALRLFLSKHFAAESSVGSVISSEEAMKHLPNKICVIVGSLNLIGSLRIIRESFIASHAITEKIPTVTDVQIQTQWDTICSKLLFLYKPNGIITVVSPQSLKFYGDGQCFLKKSVASHLLYHHRMASLSMRNQGGLLNRLDGPTSGLTFAALDEDTRFHYHRQSAVHHNVTKTYTAFVKRWNLPSWSGAETSCKLPLISTRHNGDRRPFPLFPLSLPPKGIIIDDVIHSGLKRADSTESSSFHDFLSTTAAQSENDVSAINFRKSATRFQVVNKFQYSNRFNGSTETVYQLEITLASGRRHQIRQHMASIGFPLLGDITYGGEYAMVPDLISRIALHAGSITIPVLNTAGDKIVPLTHGIMEDLALARNSNGIFDIIPNEHSGTITISTPLPLDMVSMVQKLKRRI